MRARINIKGYFIYGFADEMNEDMEMTFELARKLKEIAIGYKINFRTSVFQYRPYHGTEIYHDLLDKGVNINVTPMVADSELSNLVGRLQFNFHSGNYSKVDLETLRDYIYRTTNLNGGEIFAEFRSKRRYKYDKKL